MTALHLAQRALRHHWRTGFAAVLCLALASAVIVGSLLVGTSVRRALSDRFAGRLGAYRYAVTASGTFSSDRPDVVPAIRLTGSIADETGAVVPKVSVWGVDARFAPVDPKDGKVVLDDRLAADLSARAGTRLFIRVGKTSSAPSDTLFGRRLPDEATVELPVVVDRIERSTGPAGFTLRPSYAPSRNAFVGIAWLQRQLRMEGKANVLLSISSRPSPKWTLEDLGLSISGQVVHSDRLILTPGQIAACRKVDPRATPTSIGLATEVRNGGRSIAYAMVASVGVEGPNVNDAWVNEWAAKDLGAKPGDRLDLQFLTPRRDGAYDALRSTTMVRRVLPVDPAASSLVPELDGMTNSDKIGDWKPPFPVDLSRVTPRDEQYWKLYRATPRILVSESALWKVWGSGGYVTGMRMSLPAQAIRDRLTPMLDPADAGIATLDLRSANDKAAQGSADLGQLTLMLGFVLVLAALTLSGSVIALNVHARTSEIRLFSSLGAPRLAFRVFMLESGVLALVGAAFGVPLGVAFAKVALGMFAHFMPAQASLGPVAVRWSAPELSVGFASSAVVGMAAAWFAVWRGTRANQTDVRRPKAGRKPTFRLTMTSLVLRTVEAHRGRFAAQTFVSFAAAFVLAAVAGNMRGGATGETAYSLVATSSVPVDVDFGSVVGRRRLGFDPGNDPLYDRMRVLAMRQSPGDDASCLNPAKPTQPKVAGVPQEGEGLAGLTPNQWAKLADGSPTPAIGDAESVEWILGSGEGKVVETAGGPVKIVGLTHGTPLSGHILVSERAFKTMFPHVGGPTLFLIATPKPEAVAKALRQDLADAGMDVRLASDEVAALHGVQNAYLSIFLCLGLVGVLLGMIGAALLALRSASERRAEFALMLALGFTRLRVGALLASENLLAVLVGMLAGTLAALLVVHASATLGCLSGAVLAVAATVLACIVVAQSFLRSGLLSALRSE